MDRVTPTDRYDATTGNEGQAMSSRDGGRESGRRGARGQQTEHSVHGQRETARGPAAHVGNAGN